MRFASPLGRTHVLLVLVAACALAIRLAGLGQHSLWFDEALEYARARGTLALALFGRPVDQDPPLFALLDFVWVRLGTSEWWLRAPSALLGAATVYVAGWWALVPFGRRIGLLTALLFAFAPVQVHYSQELNQYAAVVFLSVVLILSWEIVVRQGSRRDWTTYAGTSAVALGTHYGMAFPVAALGAYLAWRTVRARDLRQARRLIAYAIAMALVVAILLALGLAARLPVWHLQKRFGGTYLGKELAYLGDMVWREVLVFFLLPFSGGLALWVVRALAVVVLVGAIALWRKGGTGRRIVGVGFFGALVAVYPMDGMGLYPVGNRYVLFATPPFLLALAAGFDWLAGRSRPLATAAVAVTMGVFVAFAPQERWPNPWLAVPREELRPVLGRLADLRRADEIVYVYFGARPAFAYYDPVPGSGVVYGEHLGPRVTPYVEAERIAAAADARPVWLIFAHERPGDRTGLVDALHRGGWRTTALVEEANAAAVRIEREGSAAGP